MQKNGVCGWKQKAPAEARDRGSMSRKNISYLYVSELCEDCVEKAISLRWE